MLDIDQIALETVFRFYSLPDDVVLILVLLRFFDESLNLFIRQTALIIRDCDTGTL